MLGTLLVSFGMNYLKASKFFVDSSVIYDFYISLHSYKNVFQFMPFDSFKNTSKLYKIIFFNQTFSFEIFIFLASLLYCLLFIYLIKSIEIKYNQTAFVFFLLFFVFDMAFLFQPSKDFVSLLVSVLVLRLIISDCKGRDVFIIILIGIYAIFFREYYIIILFLFYMLKLAATIKFKARILLFLLFAAGFSVMFYYTNYFDKVMLLRYYSYDFLSGFTNTVIRDVIPILPGEKNILKYASNYILIAIRLIFPVEVLWKSPSRGMIFFPLQLIINYIFVRYIPVVSHYIKNRKTLPDVIQKESRRITHIHIYIFSFFLVGVLFEPDFGSVFRHSMNLMPFVLYLSFSASYKNFNHSTMVNQGVKV